MEDPLWHYWWHHPNFSRADKGLKILRLHRKPGINERKKSFPASLGLWYLQDDWTQRMKILPSDRLLPHQSCFPRKYSDWQEDWGDYSGPRSPASHWNGVCDLLAQFGGTVLPRGVWLERGVSVNCCLLPKAHSFHKKAQLHSQLGKSLVSFSLQHAGAVPVHSSGSPTDDTMSLSTLFQEWPINPFKSCSKGGQWRVLGSVVIGWWR